MDLQVTLERIVRLADNDAEMIFETMRQAEIAAMHKVQRLPTLTEVLYHQTEEELLDIKELLGYAAN